MTRIESFLQELEMEAETTRKMLKLVPNDQFDWQPHPKSMTMKQLATHLAELPGWIDTTIHTDGIDFGKMDYKPTPIDSTDDLSALFEKSLEKGRSALQHTTEDELEKPWTMRNGDTVYSTSPKTDMVRHPISQIIHHRAQLGVYLRLLDIPIPGSYGPSADEPVF